MGDRADASIANPPVDASPLAEIDGSPWNPLPVFPENPPGSSSKKTPTVDSRVVADAVGTRFLENGHPAFPEPTKPQRHVLRWLGLAALVLVLATLGIVFGVPRVRYMLDTVSTDDAFVAGHTTNVAARIDDVITQVFVENNDRVEPGMLLVQLDREPFVVAVSEAQAEVDEAEANLTQAHVRLKSQLAQARSSWLRRKNAQERLRQQVATLRGAGRDPPRPRSEPETRGRGSTADRESGAARLGDSGGTRRPQYPTGSRDRKCPGSLG